MFPAQGKSSPLSSGLLAYVLARPLPPGLLQPVLNAVFSGVMRRHPDMFERLSCIENPVFQIDPTDLPLVFEFSANPADAYLRVARVASGREIATIRGPLPSLIELLEGSVDGDALFFSRTLTIKGDTEAVVALRNAIDDADIDLRVDLLATLGPLATPAHHALSLGERIYARASGDLELLRSTAQQIFAKGPNA